MVHVNPATGKTDGPYRKKLRTYLGTVASNKGDVTIDNWKQVPVAQKDLMSKDIQVFQLNVECCCNWSYQKSYIVID